jgi:hypothetical protein
MDDLEVNIFKLESLKTLLKTELFDDFIENAKIAKEMKKLKSNLPEDFEDFMGDDIPHYYGSEGELIIGDE